MIRERRLSSAAEMQKSQLLRVWDVLALGPFLIYLSNKKTMSENEAKLLTLAGALTIIYNARNWWDNK